MHFNSGDESVVASRIVEAKLLASLSIINSRISHNFNACLCVNLSALDSFLLANNSRESQNKDSKTR